MLLGEAIGVSTLRTLSNDLTGPDDANPGQGHGVVGVPSPSSLGVKMMLSESCR